ncbi:hypothetical protein PR048_031239 [Dryococelus australis]|uniref:Uncharacterized protein n=1 Tax=Dryococelus australis TaxID=614101 RepID=A0ABQ9G5T5_9NEOP|nr:hypothetical protein PR048_031239 [Dryococelus australis]
MQSSSVLEPLNSPHKLCNRSLRCNACFDVTTSGKSASLFSGSGRYEIVLSGPGQLLVEKEQYTAEATERLSRSEKLWCQFVRNNKRLRATVAEWLACSPPTKANRVQSPCQVTPGFSQVGIVRGDAAGRRRVFLGFPVPIRPCNPGQVKFAKIFVAMPDFNIPPPQQQLPLVMDTRLPGADSATPRCGRRPTSPPPPSSWNDALAACCFLFWESRECRQRRDLLASQTSSRLIEFPIHLTTTQERSGETGWCLGPPRRITRVGEDSRRRPNALYIRTQPSGRQSFDGGRLAECERVFILPWCQISAEKNTYLPQSQDAIITPVTGDEERSASRKPDKERSATEVQPVRQVVMGIVDFDNRLYTQLRPIRDLRWRPHKACKLLGPLYPIKLLTARSPSSGPGGRVHLRDEAAALFFLLASWLAARAGAQDLLKQTVHDRTNCATLPNSCCEAAEENLDERSVTLLSLRRTYTAAVSISWRIPVCRNTRERPSGRLVKSGAGKPLAVHDKEGERGETGQSFLERERERERKGGICFLVVLGEREGEQGQTFFLSTARVKLGHLVSLQDDPPSRGDFLCLSSRDGFPPPGLRRAIRGCIPPNSPTPSLPRPQNLAHSSTNHRTLILQPQSCRWGHGGVVVRLLASHQGEPGSNPGGVAPGSSHVGIVPDYAAGVGGFSRLSLQLDGPHDQTKRCSQLTKHFLKLSFEHVLEFILYPSTSCHPQYRRRRAFRATQISPLSLDKTTASTLDRLSSTRLPPIMNAVKYRVVSCVVWTNRTMVSSNRDTNRTGVLAAVGIGSSRRDKERRSVFVGGPRVTQLQPPPPPPRHFRLRSAGEATSPHDFITSRRRQA